jgi:hypothetical protein
LRERLDQYIDDACIYTTDNVLTLAASDNEDAYVENFGCEGVVEDDQINKCRLAYCALQEDVRELLDRAGFDWEDAEGTVQAALEWLKD